MKLLPVLLVFPLLAFGEMTSEPFGSIRLYHLKNGKGLEVDVTNYGATITALRVPDRNGKFDDVVLGYKKLEDYINAVDRPYFGAVVGRYGNRIANGRFRIAKRNYQLSRNEKNLTHLHGGTMGFDKVIWTAKPLTANEGNGLRLTYRAKDKEEGYPGNLDVTVTYQLTDLNELVVSYRATTDAPTPVNLTQHTYFNLKGEGSGDILLHQLQLNAPSYTPVDKSLIPTGQIAPVRDTPFDFTTAKPIGRDIRKKHPQLAFGLGYDHNFVLDPNKREGALIPCARVVEPGSGRVLEILTTEPGVQFYSGNFLDGRLRGKSGRTCVNRGGFCLEPQHFPDSPNRPEFPNTILLPSDTYHSKTIYRFSVLEK